jgi:hypothetical protein
MVSDILFGGDIKGYCEFLNILKPDRRMLFSPEKGR